LGRGIRLILDLIICGSISAGIIVGGVSPVFFGRGICLLRLKGLA